MPTTSDLIALGVPAELARRLGFQDNGTRGPSTLTAVGTAQATAAAIKKDATWLEITTAGGATAVILPANAELLVPYLTQVLVTSSTALLFPPTGHRINSVAANSSVNVAQFLPRVTMRIGATQWASWLCA